MVLVLFQEEATKGFAGQKSQKIHGNTSTYFKEFAPSTEWCHANYKKRRQIMAITERALTDAEYVVLRYALIK